MDKRHIVRTFQERLRSLIDRRGESMAVFSRRCGVDRSALSQFLDPGATRLPRAETLCAIAGSQSVSVDWLLGLSQNENTIAEVARAESIEVVEHGGGETRLAEWHREAVGYKIRYVPATLPDLLRTPAVLAYEFRGEDREYIDAKADQTQSQLAYTRRPETDMEVVMPRQRLESFAEGTGIWSGLSRAVRQGQLDHMARLLDELYPTFRLFLHDGLKAFSAPFTVFGPKRAAIYLGDMYLVTHSVEQIRELTTRFDHLIRIAEVGPDRAAAHVAGLKAR
ncbi:MAG: helix-turn-helix domain-containing protein [Nitratireductor sp.]|nr:helix-turn-helix domain-containing protein [Nitratireductor sp.]